MFATSRAALVAAALTSLIAMGSAHAQSQGMPGQVTPAQAIKQIGKPTQNHSLVPSLIVLNSLGAKLTPDTLVLTGVSANAIIFADRPVRSAGHALTAHLIEEWSQGKDSFGNDPPNATISAFDKNGQSVKDAVVVLKDPKLQGDTLTFSVDLLEGDLGTQDGAASVFIDIIGMPLTPLSFGGAARRAAYRGAFYAGAAGGGAYAYAPAYPRPYYPPPMPYYRPPYYRPFY
jgi:hypothetical protein